MLGMVSAKSKKLGMVPMDTKKIGMVYMTGHKGSVKKSTMPKKDMAEKMQTMTATFEKGL